MGKTTKRSLDSIDNYVIKARTLKEIKDISSILEKIELGDIEVEWNKTYLKEGPMYGVEFIVFKQGEGEIGLRPINITIDKVDINHNEKCNRKDKLNHIKTQEDNAWTEFVIPSLNCKLILYHNAVREINKFSDF
ncbi:MAG: hypothetical protein AABX88_02895 [Nanoarchaeota archaeon]